MGLDHLFDEEGAVCWKTMHTHIVGLTGIAPSPSLIEEPLYALLTRLILEKLNLIFMGRFSFRAFYVFTSLTLEMLNAFFAICIVHQPEKPALA